MPSPYPIVPPRIERVPWLEGIGEAGKNILGLDRINTILDFIEDP